MDSDFSDLLSPPGRSAGLYDPPDEDHLANPFADMQSSSYFHAPAPESPQQPAPLVNTAEEPASGQDQFRTDSNDENHSAENVTEPETPKANPADQLVADEPVTPIAITPAQPSASAIEIAGATQASTPFSESTPSDANYSALVSPLEAEPPLLNALGPTLLSAEDDASIRTVANSLHTMSLSQHESEPNSLHSTPPMQHHSPPEAPISLPESDQGPLASTSTAASSASTASEPSQTHEPLESRSDRPNYLITVSDPQKIGSDLTASAHTLYTIRSVSSASPNQPRTVLRRFNDFLWMYDMLCANNPGCIVPPPPEKHALGRFSGNFVEARRKGLQVFLGKVAAHPMLWNDPDFVMFLTSDTFAIDVCNLLHFTQSLVDLPNRIVQIRHRAAPPTPSTPSSFFGSFLSGIPKFTEPSEFIATRQTALAALEPSLKTFAQSLSNASRNRAALQTSLADLCAAVALLESCALSQHAKRALAGLEELYQTLSAVQKRLSLSAEAELVAVAESWSRLAGTSVKHALAARLKLWQTWQKANALAHAIARKRDAGQTSLVNELHDAERRCEDAKREFDDATKLVGAELVRFEVEKAEDFRLALQGYVEGLFKAQQEVGLYLYLLPQSPWLISGSIQIVTAWTQYGEIVQNMAAANGGPVTKQTSQQNQAAG